MQNDLTGHSPSYRAFRRTSRRGQVALEHILFPAAVFEMNSGSTAAHILLLFILAATAAAGAAAAPAAPAAASCFFARYRLRSGTYRFPLPVSVVVCLFLLN